MRKGFTLIELMIVIAIIAIIAAIAIPNLLESRVTANEAAASASLKSGIFPAAVQFQAGGYQDSDLDNVGEYGTIGAMAGTALTSKMATARELKLVTGPLASATDTTVMVPANGYLFTSIVPSATTPATNATASVWLEGDADFPIASANANNGERAFSVACMPERFSDTGRRVFSIASDGQIRSPAAVADINIWWGGAPISGTATATPVIANFRNGMSDVYAIPAYVITFLDGTTPVYPTFTK